MPKTIELVENMSYILQCNSLSGDGQQLSFHWLKDNVQIDQFKVDSEKAFSTLSLINLKRNHSGVYTCRAQSTVDGSADSVSSRLFVQGSLSHFRFISLNSFIVSFSFAAKLWRSWCVSAPPPLSVQRRDFYLLPVRLFYFVVF